MQVEGGKLPVTPRPYSDESLAGYLVRLSQVNVYEKLAWLLCFAGLSPSVYINPGIDINQINLERIAEISRSTIDELQALRLEASKFSLRQNEICTEAWPAISKILHVNRTKICPECFKDYAYARISWDIVAYTVCPYHKVHLIDRCSCGKVIKWCRHAVDKCPYCGIYYQEIPSLPVPENEIGLSKVIASKLGLLLKLDLSARNSQENPLIQLTLPQLLPLITFIAREIKFPGKANYKWEENDDIHQYMMHVWTTFEDWPNNYYHFLGNRRLKKSGKGGFQAEFGSFYKNLYQWFSAHEYDFLREEFEAYILRHWHRHCITQRTMNGVLWDNRFYISETEAAKELGIERIWVRRLIEKNILRGVINGEKKFAVILVERMDVERFKEIVKSAYTVSSLCKSLGVGETAVLEMLNDGILKAFRGPTVDGSREWLVAQEEVDILYNKISACIKPSAAERQFIINRAIRKASQIFSIPILVKAILAGKLAPCDIGERPRLDQLLFNEEDIERLKNEMASAHKGDYYTVEDLRRILGTSFKSISKWIDMGLMAAEHKHKGKKGKICRRLVHKKTLEKFINEYETVGGIAKRTGLRISEIQLILKRSEIAPVAGGEYRGDILLYRRQETSKIFGDEKVA